MKKILFIDDDQAVGRFTKETLEEYDYKVDWIRQDTWTKAEAAIKALRGKTWDLLILDIQYPTDDWGGIWLYNSLVHQGFRVRWKGRVIVYSQYFVENQNWERTQDAQMLALRVFLETARIPLDCALPNQSFDRASLLEKIEAVLKQSSKAA